MNSPSTSSPHSSPYLTSFNKFNSLLNAGLLNPMSPPPPPTKSSPTLFQMMSSEPDFQPATNPLPSTAAFATATTSISAKQARITSLLLAPSSPNNKFNDASSSDINLTLSSKDGFSVSLNVHRQILVSNSKFFAAKLCDKERLLPYVIEIAECDDVEVYIETIKLMYCKDMKKLLMKEDVPRVLDILKVSSAIGFEAGVITCLEYLEAAPWAEDEEEKVAALLSELKLEGVAAVEVLKRVSVEVTAGIGDRKNENEEVLMKLIHVVLEGKDEKARREMKGLVTKMLRENSSHNDLRKESLYAACDECLQLLKQHFLGAASSSKHEISQIVRQADNLHWLLDTLIDRQIAEDFLKTWASQSELSEAHSKVPAVHRYEISRVTARLFVGIGKAQLLASKDSRCLLLQTWLDPFYNDFGWMRRASNGLDRHLIEDGLSNTIITLPLSWQQEIFLAWFNRFLNCGEDCPNIHRGFEVWWRRAFWRRNGQSETPPHFRVAVASIDNS